MCHKWPLLLRKDTPRRFKSSFVWDSSGSWRRLMQIPLGACTCTTTFTVDYTGYTGRDGAHPAICCEQRNTCQENTVAEDLTNLQHDNDTRTHIPSWKMYSIKKRPLRNKARCNPVIPASLWNTGDNALKIKVKLQAFSMCQYAKLCIPVGMQTMELKSVTPNIDVWDESLFHIHI